MSDEQVIVRIDQSLKDLKNTVEELKSSVDKNNERTTKLAIAIGELPCGERKVIMEGLAKTIDNGAGQNKFMWAVLAVFIVLCIGAIIKSESVEAKVTYIQKEVDTIKQVSYGYVEMKRKGVE